jgi:hypothetical protein
MRLEVPAHLPSESKLHNSIPHACDALIFNLTFTAAGLEVPNHQQSNDLLVEHGTAD